MLKIIKRIEIIFILMLVLLGGLISYKNSLAESTTSESLMNITAGKAGIRADRVDNVDEATDIFVGDAVEMVRLFLQVIGVVILLFILYAGFLWVTAGGNTEQVDKAKGILKNAVIGSVIIGISYVIAGFIESKFILRS